ncbi:cysteine hydrolase family protein [Amycolatopsis jejuensis]|uniref:cysteine hydrolase family protein n=1 Tax=Amycolatopsis jejuensis TaxID=330084 RepID=UPI00068A24FB|nr:isochorismatase family cysteine hydrolase [Amycolatopsis jejuensis]
MSELPVPPGDPLAGHYVRALEPVAVRPGTTALICIDLQNFDADPAGGLFAGEPDPFPEYFAALETTVLPNVRRLQDGFRSAGAEVIHTRIRSQVADGRDRGLRHRQRGMLIPPDSRDAEFVAAVAPVPGELVFDKTTSGMFAGTAVEATLRRIGVTTLVFTGVALTNCVETSVREAADRDFDCVLVPDATAAFSKEMYDASLRVLGDSYARLATTGEILGQLGSRPAPGRTAVPK